MVGQSIQKRAGQAFRPEGFNPFVERQVAGDQCCAALIALRDQIKQQFGAGLTERHKAQFVNDESLWLTICFCSRSSRRSSPASISSWTSAAAVTKPTDWPFWQADSPRPRAMCVFPVPLGPSAMTFSYRSTHSQRASSRTCILFKAGIALKSKLSPCPAGHACMPERRAFDGWDLRRLDPALDHVAFAVNHFQFNQPRQELDVVQPFCGSQFAIFPQNGR